MAGESFMGMFCAFLVLTGFSWCHLLLSFAGNFNKKLGRAAPAQSHGKWRRKDGKSTYGNKEKLATDWHRETQIGEALRTELEFGSGLIHIGVDLCFSVASEGGPPGCRRASRLWRARWRGGLHNAYGRDGAPAPSGTSQRDVPHPLRSHSRHSYHVAAQPHRHLNTEL
jgi:hypothetical protein